MNCEATSGGRLLIFGDSIANGLGVRERRYANVIAFSQNLELVDLTRTGATILDSLSIIADGIPAADVAIVAHGITEPIYRPKPSTLRLLPKRWQRRGWMDPRPYYSRSIHRRALERLESAVRWRIKAALVKRPIFRYQLMQEQTYATHIVKLVHQLASNGTVSVVLGPPAIDERYFPGSFSSQQEYSAELVRRGLEVVQIADHLHRWDDYFLDHFHPNESGHQKIADLVGMRVEDALRSTRLKPRDAGEIPH